MADQDAASGEEMHLQLLNSWTLAVVWLLEHKKISNVHQIHVFLALNPSALPFPALGQREASPKRLPFAGPAEEDSHAGQPGTRRYFRDLELLSKISSSTRLPYMGTYLYKLPKTTFPTPVTSVLDKAAVRAFNYRFDPSVGLI